MKWQEKIGFVVFSLFIFGGALLTQGTTKAQESTARQQALEVAADYIQPSRNPYIKVDGMQERNDAFNTEYTLVPEAVVDEPTAWMRPAAQASISRMMGGRMGMRRPMYQSTCGDADLTFERSYAQMSPMMMGSGVHWIDEKNPGVAALLSLQPVPVALGNFYMDDWEKGILYTTLEVGMFIPGMILLSDRYSDHFHGGYARSSWTDTERTWFISLAAGYVALKVISAFDAAYSAERYIRRAQRVSLEVSPKMDGWALKTRASF